MIILPTRANNIPTHKTQEPPRQTAAEREQIAAWLAERETTKCPTAIVGPTSGIALGGNAPPPPAPAFNHGHPKESPLAQVNAERKADGDARSTALLADWRARGGERGRVAGGKITKQMSEEMGISLVTVQRLLRRGRELEQAA